MSEPIAPATIAELLTSAASDSPGRVAITGEREVTFGQLDAEVRSRAALLIAAGIQAGDRVAIWAANTVDNVLAMLAVIVASGVPVPLNTRWTPSEAEQIINHSQCRVVIAPTLFLNRAYAAEVLELAAKVKHDLLVLGTGEGPAPPGCTPFRGALAGSAHEICAPLERRVGKQSAGDVVMVQYTSGTTGQPRGACLRQGPMLETAFRWAQISQMAASDVYPVTYPLAHIGGFKTGIVTPLLARARSVIFPITNAESLTDAVTRHGATVVNGAPPALRWLVAAARDGSLPKPHHLRLAVLGTTIVPPQLVQDVVHELGVPDVIIAYGLTEATGVCTMTRLGDPVELVCETLGRPIDGVRVRIAGARASSDIGEIEIRGANVMIGYLDDPKATADAFDNGWLRTGDLGRIGADGYLRMAGRVKDLVIVGGFNVYPAEVEHVLIDHPDIAEAAVVGIPDERLGEVVAAFIVPASKSHPPDESAVRDWVTQRLANYKVPRRIWAIDQLPRGAVDKVAKAELVRLARTRLSAQDALPKPPDHGP